MLITAWILLVFFGLFALHGTLKFLTSRLNWLHATMWFISIIITAFSAGIIFGGLFQSFLQHLFLIVFLYLN